jgi:hypothetical protein
MRAIVVDPRLGYFRHVQFPSAGYARERGPAFSLPGTGLILLSQKVATNDDENHLFGKIHSSAMGGWNGSAKIE